MKTPQIDKKSATLGILLGTLFFGLSLFSYFAYVVIPVRTRTFEINDFQCRGGFNSYGSDFEALDLDHGAVVARYVSDRGQTIELAAWRGETLDETDRRSIFNGFTYVHDTYHRVPLFWNYITERRVLYRTFHTDSRHCYEYMDSDEIDEARSAPRSVSRSGLVNRRITGEPMPW